MHSIQKKLDLIKDLFQRGVPIILNDSKREAEADLMIPAELCSPAIINSMLVHGKGLLCISMKNSRAIELGIQRLPTNNLDKLHTPFGYPVGLKSLTTGISATDRSAVIRAIASQNNLNGELQYPGHVNTLIAHEEGLFGRKGHTECAIALSTLLGFTPYAVICEVLNSIGDVASYDELLDLKKKLNTEILDISEVVEIYDSILA